MPTQSRNEFEIVAKTVSMLEGLDRDEQMHILTTVATWLKVDPRCVTGPAKSEPSSFQPFSADIGFSQREEMIPKQFMLEKQPALDAERIACLAYYLTHYRDTQQFKLGDLRSLNTEAAQRPFSNISYSAKNATRDGFLAPAPKKGYRQLSALGEQYVNALPDRDAAIALRKRMTPKRSRRKKATRSTRKST